MRRLLSHERTKKELTEYLSAKVIQRSECMGKNFCDLEVLLSRNSFYTLTGIEKLVCQGYVPNTVIDNVKELR